MRRNHEALIIAVLFVILLILLLLSGCASEEISRPNRMRIDVSKDEHCPMWKEKKDED